MKPQLFVLSRKLFDAISWEDVYKTAEGLAECGLFKFPFPVINIRAPTDCIPVLKGYDAQSMVELEGVVTKIGRRHFERRGNYVYEKRPEYDSWMEIEKVTAAPQENESQWYYVGTTEKGVSYRFHAPGRENFGKLNNFALAHLVPFLIVTLSACNVKKTTVENKLAKLGIGRNKSDSKKRYPYITYLDVPDRIEETDSEHPGTGREVAPHLRRGHPRQQRYGVGRELVKMVWIAPVFVNADKEWVRERSAYNVGPK